MKHLILLAMFSVVFTACGGSDKPSNQGNGNTTNVSPSADNEANANAKVLASLEACPENAFALYEQFMSSAGKVSSYLNQDGSLTTAGQSANVGNEIENVRSSCKNFVQNYPQVRCKGTSAESGIEKAVIGETVVKDCDVASKYLTSIGR